MDTGKENQMKQVDKYTLISQAELKQFREHQWRIQKGICPILKQRVEFKNTVVDHKHKLKAEHYGGSERLGLIRGILHFQANVMEGKIARLYKRYGLHKFIDLPSLLHNIAEYIENPPIKRLYVHPSAIPKKKVLKLKKMDVNRVFKYWHLMYPRRKVPEIPKSGKLTKDWTIYVKQAKKMHEKKTGVVLK